ncbi:MAG: hypothetical protein HKN94_02655 [Acidimicrobiales bacterium]|nr:hypothetical protein [Acidimicrobiales bacterium]
MSRFAAALLIAVALSIAGASTPAFVDTAAAQVQDLNPEPVEDPPGLGNIVGSPDPGPKPTDAGDRGGAAQLTLAVVLFAGVGFIGFKISRAIR